MRKPCTHMMTKVPLLFHSSSRPPKCFAQWLSPSITTVIHTVLYTLMSSLTINVKILKFIQNHLYRRNKIVNEYSYRKQSYLTKINASLKLSWVLCHKALPFHMKFTFYPFPVSFPSFLFKETRIFLGVFWRFMEPVFHGDMWAVSIYYFL